MNKNVLKLLHRIINGLKWRLSRLENKLDQQRIQQIQTSGWMEVERRGLKWRLDMSSYIAQAIVVHGVWEIDTTNLIENLVKPGMVVVDVGANIGYYTILMAQKVGCKGHVYAYEPVKKYRDQLMWHVQQNGFHSRVTVVPFGLSDGARRSTIQLGIASATLHPAGNVTTSESEEIELRSLDQEAETLRLSRIDFIKIDIDGHEPRFLKGAMATLKKFHPPIALEFSQESLYMAGSNIQELVAILKDLGYILCNERTQEPFVSEIAFLKECGNYVHSGNALARNSY